MAQAATTDVTTDDAHDEHEEHHPSARDYVQIAVVLAVLTGMEFATYFIDFGVLTMPLLLGLMTLKFALIVGFFMHLKFDTKLYRRLLLTGLIGAIVLYALATLALFEFPAGTGLG
jgi:cytochrome c oxidase subunit 4